MLGPGALTTHLADLGADVIKVEPPQGDYVRQMTWPIVEGVSLLYLHISRGKRSVVLDLRTEDGGDAFLELVRGADAVVEAMRPGGLDRRGLGFEQLREVNPQIVFVTISGYGMTGPYSDMPSHGIAYDAWAGLVQPADDEDGFRVHARAPVDRHPRRAAVRRARRARRHHCAPARPARAASSRSPSPTPPPRWTGCAARPGRRTSARSRRSPATRPTTTSGARRAPRAWRTASATSSTRRTTATSCSWRRSGSSGRTSARASTGSTCSSAGRARSTPTTPRGNTELRAIAARHLRDAHDGRVDRVRAASTTRRSRRRTRRKTLLDDPQFQDRLPLIPAARLGADMLPIADQVHRRGAAGTDEGTDRRRAHRDRVARRARAGPMRRSQRRGRTAHSGPSPTSCSARRHGDASPGARSNTCTMTAVIPVSLPFAWRRPRGKNAACPVAMGTRTSSSPETQPSPSTTMNSCPNPVTCASMSPPGSNRATYTCASPEPDANATVVMRCAL